MKSIRWKTFFITCFIYLVPVLLGVVWWKNLPDEIAIHFNLYNEPDYFVSKPFAVFGLPFFMFLLQMIYCIGCDMNIKKQCSQGIFEKAGKWIIPILTIVLQTVTLGYALGWNIDIRKTAFLMIGVLLLITGGCMTQSNDMKNHKIDLYKARKINRFVGCETVIMGLFALVTIFLPPIATVIWLVLLFPYSIIGILYTMKLMRKD